MIFTKLIQQIIAGLAKWIITDPIQQAKSIAWFQGYSRKVNHLTKMHGVKQACAVVKLQQLCITRHLAGSPLYSNTLRVGMLSEGIPKDMKPLLEDIMSRDPQIIRFILTVTTAIRMIPGDGTLPHSSIVLESRSDPNTEAKIIDWCKSSIFFGSIQTSFERCSIKNIKWELPHLSTKAGPNGQALGTSLRDLSLLPDWLSGAIAVLGGRNLRDYMRTLKDSISTVPEWILKISSKSFLRRLSVVRDRATKNRPIAIMDYWSQTALIGLHKTLFGVLKELPSDCTFNQDHITTIMKKFTSYQCMDLSAATDRFPVSLQASILQLLAGPDYAQAWRDVMVKLPFHHNGEEFTYNAGQPMGAYSSWAMFALSHHVIVQYAASLNGLIPFTDYAILGDDIVIGNPEVAKTYREIIKSLGMEVSDSKSHEGLHLLEFTKRFWYNYQGNLVEVTGFPLPGLLESLRNPFLIAQELTRAIKRQTLDVSNVPVSTSLSLFFSEWMGPRSSARLTTLIQEWWATVQLDNWVNSDLSQSSPPVVSCSHTDEQRKEFFQGLIIDQMDKQLKLLRVKLTHVINEALESNELGAQEFMKYHESGPDRDSLPNLHGVYFQPWFLVMENQVNLVDHYHELVKSSRLTGAGLNLEEYHTWLGQVRICSPETIRSTRNADIILSNKRKQFSELLPYVRWQ